MRSEAHEIDEVSVTSNTKGLIIFPSSNNTAFLKRLNPKKILRYDYDHNFFFAGN